MLDQKSFLSSIGYMSKDFKTEDVSGEEKSWTGTLKIDGFGEL